MKASPVVHRDVFLALGHVSGIGRVSGSGACFRHWPCFWLWGMFQALAVFLALGHVSGTGYILPAQIRSEYMSLPLLLYPKSLLHVNIC